MLSPEFQEIVDSFLASESACVGAGGRPISPNTRNDNDLTSSAPRQYHAATRSLPLCRGRRILCDNREVLHEQNLNVPFNFTDSELAALFSEIDRLPADRGDPFLNEIVPTLLRLTYTCGLRPRESRELLANLQSLLKSDDVQGY